tara:strand:+ start:235 stop:483 length:249 start_codon:yes stop_codon:yes gene_type:complete
MKLGKIVKVTAIVTTVAVGSAEMAQAYSWGTFGGGNSWTTWGNRTFGSDGSSMTTWGNRTFGSFGGGGNFSCTTWGNRTFCN